MYRVSRDKPHRKRSEEMKENIPCLSDIQQEHAKSSLQWNRLRILSVSKGCTVR